MSCPNLKTTFNVVFFRSGIFYYLHQMKSRQFFIVFTIIVIIAATIFGFKGPSDRQKEMELIGNTMKGAYPYFPETGNAGFLVLKEDEAIMQETRFMIVPRHLEPVRSLREKDTLTEPAKHIQKGDTLLVIWRHTINDSTLQRYLPGHLVFWQTSDSIFNYYLVKH